MYLDPSSEIFRHIGVCLCFVWKLCGMHIPRPMGSAVSGDHERLHCTADISTRSCSVTKLSCSTFPKRRA
ncbi:hypothetical protein M3J09_004575 [Ascochyta lentis]